MSEPRAVLQITGRVPARTLVRLQRLIGDYSLQTLLRLVVRDEAELQGVLRRLHDLGLDLVGIRALEDTTRRRSMEATVNGAIGDVALESLGDYVEIQQTATRISFSDSTALSQGLGELVAEGMTVEYASALPAPALPLGTTPTP